MSKVEVDAIEPQSGTALTIGASGDTITIPSGATLVNNGTASGFGDNLEWQSSIVTATTLTAVANRGYWIDTTSNVCTITLPGSASVGDRLIFTDYARTWATYNVTINPNSLNFQGRTTPQPVYATAGQSVDIVYSGATKGWIPNSDDDVTWETQPPPYTAHFLVIAGGGGGGGPQGSYGGGGGGAGGYRNSFNSETSGRGSSAETPLSFNVGTVYTITVGDGGAKGGNGAVGTVGQDSSIAGSDITNIVSAGGGYGASGAGAPNAGGTGGAGGGGGYAGSAGPGTANQGYDGSIGVGSAQDPKGGGGGAGSGATDAAGNAGGAGGNGLSSTITGAAVTRAGGSGGGAGSGGSAGAGGTGGGLTAGGGDAAANTGAGGAGAMANLSDNGAGGSGVVFIRIPDANYSGTTTGSPIVSANVGGSGETVLTFNASGSYTG